MKQGGGQGESSDWTVKQGGGQGESSDWTVKQGGGQGENSDRDGDVEPEGGTVAVRQLLEVQFLGHLHSASLCVGHGETVAAVVLAAPTDNRIQTHNNNNNNNNNNGAFVKASTLRLISLNKHNITCIIYIQMENFISNSTKLTHNVDIKKG